MAAGGSTTPDLEAARWMQKMHNFEKVLEAPPIPLRLRRMRRLRVPQEQKKVNPEAYTPKLLFLGFRNRPDPVEDLGVDKYKVEWARQFLAWKADTKASGGEEDEAGVESAEDPRDVGRDVGEEWNQFVRDLEIDEQSARSVYEIKTGVGAEVIQKVLALDALFLLLLILKIPRRQMLPEKYFGRDCMAQPHDFGYGYPWAKLFSDMFLLENQVPLYILTRVWRSFPGQSDSVELPLSDLLYHRFVYLFPEATLGSSRAPVMEIISKIRHDRCDHLLHCLLRLICYSPAPHGKKHYGGAISVPSASAMTKVGMRCSRKGITFLHEIRFDQARACLMLPCIKIQSWTEGYLRNLVALESTLESPGMMTVLAAYLSLLDDLVDNERDVELLSKDGVMIPMLGSGSEVAHVCNMVVSGGGLAQSTEWAQILVQVNDRYKSRRRQLVAEFKKLYFSRPWVTVSLVAGIVLLLMTALQTVYALLSYYE